ncbi:type II CAAX prenyl endopeptidase Rce1 family protein [Nocardiopsis sp. LOL_012]|uniref:CPBP family glutamic-type intramembrane protease n=1 Tax=Nocardiopsis sp. LOL_012 TaxID=3345409 RepID=UPI003A8B1874
MTETRSWGLTSAGVFFAVVVLAMLASASLRAEVLGPDLPIFLAGWGVEVAGAVMAFALVRWFGDRDGLDLRIRLAMEEHPVGRELGLLFGFLGGFIVLMVLLSGIFSLLSGEIGADLRMSAAMVSRLLFMFALPLLFMDRAGYTVSGPGFAMASLAVAVREPWRWLGLIPVVFFVGVLGAAAMPTYGLMGLSLAALGLVLAFALIAVCEEIFFRGMVQTRLELVMGRWGGIFATAGIYSLSYALTQPYDIVGQFSRTDPVYDVGLALCIYGSVALFHGCLWTCYRNIWLNVFVHLCGMLILLRPEVTSPLF